MFTRKQAIPISSIVLTCEHAGNIVPKNLKNYLAENSWVLSTHRGYDLGIYNIFQYLSGKLTTNSYAHTISRLVVDVNRSIGNPQLFSKYMSNLDEKGQGLILKSYYYPYRNKVERKLEKLLNNKKGLILHISLHSFTPVLCGKRRDAKIGILFDPKSKNELKFSKLLQKNLKEFNSFSSVKLNYPYNGTDDGFTTYLRKRFGSRYIGIELELNQNICKQKNISAKILEAIRMSVSLDDYSTKF